MQIISRFKQFLLYIVVCC